MYRVQAGGMTHVDMQSAVASGTALGPLLNSWFQEHRPSRTCQAADCQRQHRTQQPGAFFGEFRWWGLGLSIPDFMQPPKASPQSLQFASKNLDR